MTPLVRNTLWNVFGAGLPILVAVLAVPAIIEGFGTIQFGLLTLVWALLGYFTVFDLGVGRAITQSVAALPDDQKAGELPSIFWTGAGIITVVGLVAAATMSTGAHLIVDRFIQPPPELRLHTYNAVLITAFGIPVVTASVAAAGVLEGYKRFDIVNKGRAVLGVWMVGSPLFVLQSSQKLPLVCGLLIAGRFAMTVYYFVHCKTLSPYFFDLSRVSFSQVRRLLAFGGWMTVSNVISPLLVSADRFFIGATLGMSWVAYYSTPFEVIARTTIIPVALSAALFPGFAALLTKGSEEASKVYSLASRVLVVLLFPIYLSIVFAAPYGLDLWLDDSFVRHSTSVLQILAIGVFFNSLAQLPFALVHGAGRPDLTAFLHFAEALVYFPLLAILTSILGIEGAAIAWTVRVGVDFIALTALARRWVDDESGMLMRTGVVLSAETAVLVLMAMATPRSASAWALLSLGMFVILASAIVAFTSTERIRAVARIRKAVR
ncbi:MAG: flippase [Proteobacteria bacterium]|nr:flippase [Pseudomonadota bacterium]